MATFPRGRLLTLLAWLCTTACGATQTPAPEKRVIVAGALPVGEEAPSDTWKVGHEVTAQFVLKPATRAGAACATPSAFDGLRCAFTEPGTRARPLARGTLLQRVETVDGGPMLVAGIWSSSDVQQHLQQSDTPFLVSCRVVALGEAEGAQLRPDADAKWEGRRVFRVGRAHGCTVESEVATGGEAAVAEAVELAAPPPVPAPALAPLPRVHVPLAAHSPRIGPKNAKVTILEFADYQCPHCVRLAPTLERVARANPKNVALHFRHFPLSFHHRAMPAAVAVQAAERQGKGFALSKLLFANFKALTDADILNHASTAGLRLGKFRLDLKNPKVTAEVKADQDAARKSGVVRGTPTVLINGKRYMGPRTDAALQAAIDAEVLRADGMLAGGVARANLYKTLCQ